MQSKLVAELFLPIPEPSHMSGRVELGSFEFSSDHQVFYKHEGVGSGEYTTLTSENALTLPCASARFAYRGIFISFALVGRIHSLVNFHTNCAIR